MINELINILLIFHMKTIRELIDSHRQPISTRTRSKRSARKLASEPVEWVSVTELNHFCQNDLLADWCSVLRSENDEKIVCDEALSFLFEKGKEYEAHVIQHIRQKTGLELLPHSSHATSRLYNDRDGLIDYNRVVQSMKRGDAIIYSAYLHDPVRRLRGIPDLLVRNDHIQTLFPDAELNIQHGISRFGLYYYIPVEIKFSSIPLSANGTSVANVDRIPFYKTQLYAYCSLLQTIQGWQPSCAFLIGKRTVHKESVYHSLSRPGVVDYTSRDLSFISTFHEGMNWLRRVKKFGPVWNLDDVRSFPLNMKCVDPLHQKDKKELAYISGEITEIWQCGIEQRKRAYEMGIYSWNDTRLTAEVMGIPMAYRQNVDSILKVNRGELGMYHPTQLVDKIPDGPEMFVDFETLHDTFDIQQPLNNPECIFLIGAYYNNKYTQFRVNTLEDEREMIMSFYQFWVDCGKPRCWFWYAETELWKRALQRHSIVLPEAVSWVDLYDLIRRESFVVKGCKSFKLKHYISSLSSLALIPVSMPPETCGSGLEAMVIAWKYYKEPRTVKTEEQMNEVITYNQFDCKALYYLVNFLREL